MSHHLEDRTVYSKFSLLTFIKIAVAYPQAYPGTTPFWYTQRFFGASILALSFMKAAQPKAHIT